MKNNRMFTPKDPETCFKKLFDYVHNDIVFDSSEFFAEPLNIDDRKIFQSLAFIDDISSYESFRAGMYECGHYDLHISYFIAGIDAPFIARISFEREDLKWKVRTIQLAKNEDDGSVVLISLFDEFITPEEKLTELNNRFKVDNEIEFEDYVSWDILDDEKRFICLVNFMAELNKVNVVKHEACDCRNRYWLSLNNDDRQQGNYKVEFERSFLNWRISDVLAPVINIGTEEVNYLSIFEEVQSEEEDE